MANSGYKGIIHAGLGNGNIHKNVFPELINARNKGILIVRSTRVPTGPTTLDAEVDDNQYKFIASQELNPQKSRILLMLALTKTNDWKQIQQYFNEYLIHKSTPSPLKQDLVLYSICNSSYNN